MNALVLVGGGEHACVVADAARSGGAWELRGYSGPIAGELLEARYGVPHLGDDARVVVEHADAHFVLAVGDQRTRRKVLALLEAAGVPFANVIHPRAIVAADATLGAGAVVMAGAIVNPGAFVAAHAIVNSGAIVEHDVHLGKLVHVAPAAAIGGGTRIGAEAFVGLGARVRDHVNVGASAVIGMGAVVVEDVDEGDTVWGVPARRSRA